MKAFPDHRGQPNNRQKMIQVMAEIFWSASVAEENFSKRKLSKSRGWEIGQVVSLKAGVNL